MLETRLLNHSRVHTRGPDSPGVSMMDEVVCDYVCKEWGWLCVCVCVCVDTYVCVGHRSVECPRGLALQSNGAFQKRGAKSSLTSVVTQTRMGQKKKEKKCSM